MREPEKRFYIGIDESEPFGPMDRNHVINTYRKMLNAGQLGTKPTMPYVVIWAKQFDVIVPSGRRYSAIQDDEEVDSIAKAMNTIYQEWVKR